MSPEAYAAMKKKEEADRKKKQFGKGAARGFESRSMQSFVAGLEKGETKHLFPVNPAKVRTGEIALKDVPYMQRGGSWTNSDLTQKKKGAIAASRGAAAPSRHRRASSSREEVGGRFFFDFEAVRTIVTRDPHAGGSAAISCSRPSRWASFAAWWRSFRTGSTSGRTSGS